MKEIDNTNNNGQTRYIVIHAILGLAISLITGCSVFGPKSINMGRAVYNDSINRTEDEQMLLSMVKGRYGETFSLLAVKGIAANVNFKANAGFDIGMGAQRNYDGNLTPLSGGFSYEENPTITYAPVQGEKYLRQLMSPVPLDILMLITSNKKSKYSYFSALTKQINGLRNRDFLESPSDSCNLRFERFISLARELDQANIIQWVSVPDHNTGFELLISDYAPDQAAKIADFLKLLGADSKLLEKNTVILPVSSGIKGSNAEMDEILISTRSTFELIEIMKAAVDIPSEHLEKGVACTYPALSTQGANLHIYHSKNKPAGAAIAVKHRGYWFYIDDSDMQTKLFYLMVRTLWSLSISAVADQVSAPVMTIPLSK